MPRPLVLLALTAVVLLLVCPLAAARFERHAGAPRPARVAAAMDGRLGAAVTTNATVVQLSVGRVTTVLAQPATLSMLSLTLPKSTSAADTPVTFVSFVSGALVLDVFASLNAAPTNVSYDFRSVQRSELDWELWVPAQPLNADGSAPVLQLLLTVACGIDCITPMPVAIDVETANMLNNISSSFDIVQLTGTLVANQKAWYAVPQGTPQLSPSFVAELCDFPTGMSYGAQFFLTVYASEAAPIFFLGPDNCAQTTYNAFTETETESVRMSVCPAHLTFGHTPNQLFYFSIFAFEDPAENVGVPALSSFRILFMAQASVPYATRLGAVRLHNDFYLSIADTGVQRGRITANYSVVFTDTTGWNSLQRTAVDQWSLMNHACFLRASNVTIVHNNVRTRANTEPGKAQHGWSSNGGWSSSSLWVRDAIQNANWTLNVVAHTNTLDVLAYDFFVPVSPFEFEPPRVVYGFTLTSALVAGGLAAALLISLAVNVGVLLSFCRPDGRVSTDDYQPIR